MNQKRLFLSTVLALGLYGSHAFALAQSSKEDAKAMVDAAVEHVKKVGPEKAFKDFTSDAAWKKKDLYVMAYDNKGNVVGHGANEKLIGKNLIEMKDPNGVMVVAELTKTATTKGEGWVDYSWPHPQTKKLEDKSTYVRKLSNFDGWVGVGIYR
ncbi:cache domain-containing protein [Rhizobacter sp. J219]|jgi:cytochrome c|uniref:cache domain-containing protein n=1 Tax=Rhizobacter sp. J219 TaxID=2898430 RepID=UPI0021507E82|nr:cache domain-containing protein [Rhizobacter sp. J219]MCR5881737.1 cache domain-containing protein [Rhizobacter sp. J219]